MRKFKNLSCILFVAQCFWTAKGAEPANVYDKLRGMSCTIFGAEPGWRDVTSSKARLRLVNKFSPTLTKQDYTEIANHLRAERNGEVFLVVWYTLIEINSEDSNRVAEDVREELVREESIKAKSRFDKGQTGRIEILNTTSDPQEWRRQQGKHLTELKQ